MCALPAGASAVELACGAIITEDTELTADVVCAEGEAVAAPDGWATFALLIAADEVKLDLNGHQVGSDWSEGIGAFGRSGVTVEGNGGFTYEVHFRNTTDSHITGIRAGWIALAGADRNRVTDSDGGIGLYDDSDYNAVEHNYARGEGGGVSLWNGSDRNVVRDNVVCGGMGDPLSIEASSYNLIEHNVVPGCLGYYRTGMQVFGASTGNRLIANTVIGDGHYYDPEFGGGTRHPSAQPRDVPVRQRRQQLRWLRDRRRRGCQVGRELRQRQRHPGAVPERDLRARLSASGSSRR